MSERNNGYSGERGKCPTCGKSVALLVPRGGDGSAFVYRTHTADKGICRSSRAFAPIADRSKGAHDA